MSSIAPSRLSALSITDQPAPATSAEQAARQIGQVLQRAGLVHRHADNSREMLADDAATRICLPETLRALRAIVYDEVMLCHLVRFVCQRAMAEKSDALAVQEHIDKALVRLVKTVVANKLPWRLSRPIGLENLVQITAAHYDGCFFCPALPSHRGGQGQVWCGITAAGQPLAVKGLLPPDQCLSADPAPLAQRLLWQPAALAREVHFLQRGAVHSYIDWVQWPGSDLLVMPLFSGTLSDHANNLFNVDEKRLSSLRDRKPRLRAARHWLRHLLSNLHVLHRDAFIAHQDLKPSNILVSKTHQRLLFGDWGFARDIDRSSKTTSFGGFTARYAAPEQLQRDKSITSACDVFNLGVCFIDLLSTHSNHVIAAREHRFPISSCTELLNPSFPHESPLWLRKQLNLFFEQEQTSRTVDGLDARALVHFQSIFEPLQSEDKPLADLLGAMVHQEPRLRPTALGALTMLNGSSRPTTDQRIAESAWKAVPQYLASDWQYIVWLQAMVGRAMGANWKRAA